MKPFNIVVHPGALTSQEIEVFRREGHTVSVLITREIQEAIHEHQESETSAGDDPEPGVSARGAGEL